MQRWKSRTKHCSRQGKPATFCRDQDEGRTGGLRLTDAWIAGTLARPDMAKGDDLGVVCCGDSGNGKGRCVASQADGKPARRWHG
jgi:hypothetical protein